MAIEPLTIGVCSWSLQVGNVPELKRLMDRLGIDVVQIACGDPHHAAWNEGDNMPPIGPDYADSVAPYYFNWRKTSIYGGSNEIQRNIIAKAVLRL